MCFSQGSLNLPDTICDTSTLSLSIDNQGVATLQINILKKTGSIRVGSGVSISIGGRTLSGFIDSDTPKVLAGTNYTEHTIVVVGEISGGPGF